MAIFGHLRGLRGGAPTRLGDISQRVDQHRLGGGGTGGVPDFLGIVPPYTRDWGNYQTFWRGNQYPGFGLNQGQYAYPFQAIRSGGVGGVGNSTTFARLSGGQISQQVGSVSIGRLLDKMRAAWASSQS